MCNVEDSCECQDLVIPSRLPALSRCRTCEKKARVLLRGKDAYCEDCFLTYSTHKFRATLGKSKMLKSGDRVLVLYVEGYSSMAMLHLLRAGLSENSNKRIQFNVDFLYIDDGAVFNCNEEERREHVRHAQEAVELFDFKIFITTLSQVLCDRKCAWDNLQIDTIRDEQLKELFSSVMSKTAKKDLLFQIRQRLLVNVAESLGYKKVFVPELGSELATKLLVGISLGRGDQMSAEMSFCDYRNSNVAVLRPLKEFTSKEIVFYNVFHSLEPYIKPLLQRFANVGSIQTVTEDFVEELQDMFPSTVYTIFRTGDKLKNEKAEDGSGKECALCFRNMSIRGGDDMNVGRAVALSRKMCQPRTSLEKCVNCDSYWDVGLCICDTLDLHDFAEEGKFCYACSAILRDSGRSGDFWDQLCETPANTRNAIEGEAHDSIP